MSVLELALKALMQPGNTTLWHQAVNALRNELERREPVAQYSDIVSDGGMDPRRAFDHSPERETEQEPVAWQSLTDKEISALFPAHLRGDYKDLIPYSFASAIEAKLKEKNSF